MTSAVKKVRIRPSLFRQLGDPAGASFCLMTSDDLATSFVIEEQGSYSSYQVVTFDGPDSFEQAMREQVPARAHVLVASPTATFRSPSPDVLGTERKLLVMACNSTPASLEAIEHFLVAAERTDPLKQQEVADKLLDRIATADYLVFVDDRYGTSAKFDHHAATYTWYQQAGPIGWGEQQAIPSGEISVFPIDNFEFDETQRLAVEGELAICGYPIVHSGATSFTREDQARIYERLTPLEHHAVIASLDHGAVTELRASHRDVVDAAAMLETLFDVDSRYRILWEIGLSISNVLTRLAGNHAMNEVCGGANGTLHLGLGLTPYTQYHLDVLCTGLRVAAADGSTILGAHGASQDGSPRIVPRKVAQCPCSE